MMMPVRHRDTREGNFWFCQVTNFAFDLSAETLLASPLRGSVRAATDVQPR